jgi:hypothetical protein
LPVPRRRLILAIAAVVIAAAVGVGAFLLSRGGTEPPKRPLARATPTPTATKTPAPRAKFRIKLLPSITTGRSQKASGHLSAKQVRARRTKVRRMARGTAKKVRSVVERLYTDAFLDVRRPAQRWLRLFANNGARYQAWKRRQVVTIGRKDRKVDQLRQQHGKLGVRVLIGRRGHPVTAYAAASFRAVGRLRSGKRLVVVSTGRYFLKRGEHRWVVYSFDVGRDDRTKAA